MNGNGIIIGTRFKWLLGIGLWDGKITGFAIVLYGENANAMAKEMFREVSSADSIIIRWGRFFVWSSISLPRL